MMRSIGDIFHSYEMLDAEGRHVNGTDKNGPNHRYGDAYESLFEDRNAVKLVMEVGVADGSCLLAWRDVFPNAVIVGMDIHPAGRINPMVNDRIEFTIGDQTSQRDCMNVASGRQFDLIVDDATHLPGDTLRTLLYLWPHVRQGGLYVIEEFFNIGGLRSNVKELWPFAEVVDTVGPSGGIEPLVVFRKPI